MTNASIDRFLHGHSAPNNRIRSGTQLRRAVTISRQVGCGAVSIAEQLAEYLQRNAPQEYAPWTVFDRGLMDKVLADHNLPGYLAKFLPEDSASYLEDALAEIFHVHPPTQVVIQHAAETILQLARLGGAIIIGRAGNIVTARLPGVLHVRLVAPLEDRIEWVCRNHQKTPDEARRFCLEEEQARARYVRTYFHADINDGLLYHLVINTSRVGLENSVRLIGDAALCLGK